MSDDEQGGIPYRALIDSIDLDWRHEHIGGIWDLPGPQLLEALRMQGVRPAWAQAPRAGYDLSATATEDAAASERVLLAEVRDPEVQAARHVRAQQARGERFAHAREEAGTVAFLAVLGLWAAWCLWCIGAHSLECLGVIR